MAYKQALSKKLPGKSNVNTKGWDMTTINFIGEKYFPEVIFIKKMCMPGCQLYGIPEKNMSGNKISKQGKTQKNKDQS